MELFIIRHAIAMDREKFRKLNLDDHQRPLTREGIKKFEKIAGALKPLLGSIDLIVSSPLVRARQTTDILSKQFPKVKILISPALDPTAKPESLADWCNENLKKKIKRVVIVGHEPHLSLLASWLMFGKAETKIDLKKGGCLSLTLENGVIANSGVLNWALTPKCLKIKST